MFQSEELENHLKTSDTIQVEAAVYAEWNMNQPGNIARLGNYRYRPTYSASQYFLIPMTYDPADIGNYYTGATDSDIAIDSGFDDNDQPTIFISPKEKMKLLYSLEDCTKPHRPRSGINKPLYLGVDEVNQLPVRYTVTNKVKTGGVATLTIGSHLLTIGDQIFVSISDANFNGTHSVSNVGFDPITNTNTTVSYVSTGTVASAVASGTVTQISNEPFFKPSQFITNPSPIDKVTEKQEEKTNQYYIVNRPRYYMSHKDDIFKYWTSYRSEYGMPTPRPDTVVSQVLRQVDRGISFSQDNRFYIEDAAPFIVYKDQVPTNKIVVKMQTNVGDVDLGNLRYNNKSLPDPLYGDANKTTPTIWRIEKLNQDDTWESIIQFDETSVRVDDSPIIGFDGCVEVSYGLQIPQEYQDIFIFADTITSETLLPEFAPVGYAYLVKEEEHELGTFHIYVTNDKEDAETFVPNYSWQVSNETINYNSKFVTQAANPDYFTDINGLDQFREFEWVLGLRVVVETMNKNNCTFDLIELSPRLVVDLTESTSSFSVTKTMSDLGNSSVPVGGLFASTGDIEIFDTDFSFNQNNIFDFDTNQGSILADYLNMPVKFLFYDITRNVDGIDYFIPVKTMYSESFPQVTGAGSTVSVSLRDMFFFLESMPAPELLLTDVSLSWAITVLLDYCGFSNYTFRRIKGYTEAIIPFFFVEPDQNVATVLEKLAVATQSAMFFDEYNNFIVMSKEYLLPKDNKERGTDSTLYGQVEEDNLPNIINLSSIDKKIYNDGQINYTVRYIQRSIGSTKTAQKLDNYKQYIYKPVLLWEVQGRESTKTINQLGSQNSGYTLGAVPLNTDLTDEIPYVLNNTIYNNIIDAGENVYWIPSFAGYFYANGEVIKFDAVQYTVSGQSGPIWITDNQQYQDYMSSLTFNGKMYPTGNVRIYTKPEYEIIDDVVNLKNGQIKEHGRGQFGTPISNHSAGLINDDYWTNNSTVRGCIMDSSKYLFTTSSSIVYPTTMGKGVSGKIQDSPYVDSDKFSQSSTRNGIIKNFLAEKYATEEEINYYKTTGPGTIQTSALVFNGPGFTDKKIEPSSFISYVYKDFIDQNGESIPYKHFGTRLRIVGKIESGTNKSQTPVGGYPIFEGSDESPTLGPNSPDQEIKIYGGSGGLGFNLNKETNNGYFYEIVALTADNIGGYASDNNSGSVVANILSTPNPSCTSNTVTVYTKDQISFRVGQQVLISGLTDTDKPQNTSTPLNGDYVISAINSDKKSFKYIIPTPTQTTFSIISASSTGTTIRYIINPGNTRGSYVDVGDKINISGTSNALFNINNAIIKTFTRLNSGWSFTIDSTVASGGTATGGTADYVSLTTTSSSGGIATQAIAEDVNIANMYFYKTLSDDKLNKFSSYSISSNVLTLFFEGQSDPDVTKNKFLVGEDVYIDASNTIPDGKYRITDISNSTVKVSYTSANIGKTSLGGTIKLINPKAIPYKLWSGLAQINVDSGDFVGQNRLAGEDSTSVYDLAAESINIGSSRRFFLYFNGKQIATVDDTDPLPEYNNLALFVRGSSRCMFENVYALANNYSQNTNFTVDTGIAQIFGDDQIDASESLRKYAISGLIQKTYLSGISSAESPQYKIYFEEFGTILRELAYFNIKYDRAYPALYAKLMKTMNRVKGYASSGFYAGSYGADFLIFNCTDFNLNLDDTSGNYLRIQGIAFTQDTTYTLTVDDYFKKKSILLDTEIGTSSTINNPFRTLEEYNKIKNSRMKYGVNQFSPIDSPYIQSTDVAENVFGWIIDNVSVPKKAVGINTFGTTNLQLGDIVTINYKDLQGDGISIISPDDTRFVIYNMEYKKDSSGLSTTLYLVEV